MEITLNNFRGIQEAKILAMPVALIAGENGAGKTSVALAAHALLSRNVLPLAGLKKKDAKGIVRESFKKAYASLDRGGGSTTNVNWPGCELASGNEAAVSPWLTGQQSLLNLDSGKLTGALKDLIGAYPTKEDVLEIQGVSQDGLEALWKRIVAEGWEEAYAALKESGTRQKGAWEQATGERFGAAKAKNWYPEGYDLVPSFEGEDAEEKLLRALQDAEEKLDEIKAKGVVLGSRVEELNQKANQAHKDDLAASLKQKEAEAEKLQSEVDDFSAQVQALPPTIGDKAFTACCPDCQASLQVRLTYSREDVTGVSLFTEKANFENRKDEDRLKRASLVTQLENAQQALKQSINEKGVIEGQIAESKRAEEELAQYKAVGTDQGGELDSASLAARMASADLAAFNKWREAKAIFEKIHNNLLVQEAMAPGGLPKKALVDSITSFNERLAHLAKTASWPVLHFNDELEISVGRRPYIFCSESEQWRADAMLRLALAEKVEDPAVVLDRADILAKRARNQLFKLLKSCGTTALVMMTMNDIEQVPDLGKAGIGNSYWIENGEAVLVHKDQSSQQQAA